MTAQPTQTAENCQLCLGSLKLKPELSSQVSGDTFCDPYNGVDAAFDVGIRRRPEDIAGWPAINRILTPIELDGEAKAREQEEARRRATG